MHHSTIPWKEIVISGHVLSSEKDKISKSKGNTPTDPENLLKVHPADAIRFWTASGTLGQDISFSETQLSQGNKLLNKLWNAFRFLEEHVAQAPAAQPETLGTLNEWLLHKATKQYTIYQANLDKHEFGNALNAVEQFFWQDFCDNYLELVKDQFFNPEKYPAEIIAATRWTLYQTGLRILQMFAPYLPHITEELYGLLYQKREGTLSIHITNYTTVQIPMLSPKNAELGDLLIAIVGAVRRMKTEKQLSLKAPLTSLTIHSVHGETLKALLQHEQLLKGVIHADTISYATGDVEKSTLTMEHEVWFATLDIDHITDTKEQA
jgi:valyl-tRNA synthetase